MDPQSQHYLSPMSQRSRCEVLTEDVGVHRAPPRAQLQGGQEAHRRSDSMRRPWCPSTCGFSFSAQSCESSARCPLAGVQARADPPFFARRARADPFRLQIRFCLLS